MGVVCDDDNVVYDERACPWFGLDDIILWWVDNEYAIWLESDEREC